MKRFKPAYSGPERALLKLDRSINSVIPAKAGTHASRHKFYGEPYIAPMASPVMKQPCVYLLASKRDGVLYIGVTSDLAHRMAEHSQGLIPGFTHRHRITHLVYYEMHATMVEAIAREKRFKEWRRAWKVRLIEPMNPEWRNLFDPETGEIEFGPADTARANR